MHFDDKELRCSDCGTTFVFTAGEQVFFHAKRFKNIPKRCKECKAKRKHNPNKIIRPQTQTICAECGLKTTVPFVPKQGRPVLCRSCFEKQTSGTAV